MVRGVTGGGDDVQSQGLLAHPPFQKIMCLDLLGALAAPDKHACTDVSACQTINTN